MTRKFDIADALLSLAPGKNFTLIGDTYDGLEWLDDPKFKPSEEELLDEVERLQSEYESNEYQRLRVQNYPSIQDQLDMLYHGGFDAWKAEIKSIKDTYPKN